MANFGGLVFTRKAFVKMVGANVNAMEEQVTQAEGEVGTLPGAFKKIFRTMSVPGFLNVRTHDILVWTSLLSFAEILVWE